MKIAVISRGECDLERILASHAEIVRIDPDCKTELAGYDACAILGGTSDAPLLLPIDMRLETEKLRKAGKPLFAEWVEGIGYAYANDLTPTPTVSHRMVYTGDETDALKSGDLLDDRANSFLSFNAINGDAKPILCLAGHVIGHDRIDELPEYKRNDYALWRDGNIVVASFRLCNFVRARFAPKERWDAVISQIVSHLLGKAVKVNTPAAVCMDHPACSPRECFKKGLEWFSGAEILINGGKDGVLEGPSHRILPDGRQLYSKTVRNDCSGEVGGAYFFDYLLNKNDESLKIFENIQEFCFEKLYEKDEPHRGMMRWSTTAWGICYQDDVARTILGSLLSMQLSPSRKYLSEICDALDFLLGTTGSDGLRISFTQEQNLTPATLKKLTAEPSGFTCAHHNGYYMAVLLLAYKITGEKRYLDAAIKGIDSLMAVFPDTIREHSETQELCRLILPLACLCEATGKAEHREYLYRVVDRLEQYRDSRGGYLEHDTGYKAKRSRTSGTESSLLAENGDPVQDLLYSVNWLPLAFAYAYKATKDERFGELWRDTVRFLSEIQAESADPRLAGSWCRAIDSVRREAYGMPHDIGWGPCVIESGWTVAEILMGIGFGITLGLDCE